MVAIGLYASTSLNLVWAACNHSGYFKRAFAMGIIQLVGNSAGAAVRITDGCSVPMLDLC